MRSYMCKKDNELYNIDDVINFQILKVCRYSNIPRKDLYQIAYLGYLRAQHYYNPEYGPISLSYVSKCIRDALMTENHEDRQYRNLKKPVFTEEETTEAPDTSNLSASPLINKIKGILHKLPLDEAEIIRETYLSDKPKRLKDLAAIRGTSKQRIHSIKARGLARLRKLLKEDIK